MARPAYDPLVATRPRALRRQVRRDVMANILPIERQITREIGRRSRAGAQNITAIADELARSLGGLADQQRDIYGRNATAVGELDTKIADRLTAAGEAGAADLTARGKLSGLPSALVESLAGGARSAGAGVGAASFAHGGAELAALRRRGAEAEGYAAKLPGFARLSGLQGVRELEAASQRDQATQLDRLRAQVPSLISSALRDARNRELNKAIAKLGASTDIYGTNVRAATSQANAATSAVTSTSNTATRTAATARQPHEGLSRAAGYWVDSTGKPILRNGKRVKFKEKPSKKGGGGNTNWNRG